MGVCVPSTIREIELLMMLRTWWWRYYLPQLLNGVHERRRHADSEEVVSHVAEVVVLLPKRD